ncbi:Methyltransferase-like protein 4 [Oleoguttula sp. CCFEE 5521]
MVEQGSSSVLWQSEDHTVTVIDIPRSIAAAQGTSEHPCHDEIASTAAIATTYANNEPRSGKAKQALAGQAVDSELHGEYEALLGQALCHVRCHHSGPWHLPRYVLEKARHVAKKRKSDAVNESSASLPGPPTSCLADRKDLVSSPDEVLSAISKSSLIVFNGMPVDATEKSTFSSSNEMEIPSQLTIRNSTAVPNAVFRIPPKSSFHLGDCADLTDFHAAIRAQAEHLDTRRKFDLILLDPPWPNRSVRRTHKTIDSTYTIASSLNDVYALVMGMDLDMLMETDCVVGIWITNKAQVRELILGEDGIFACWGVELVEEWIWLKTTTQGEPVTPIDAVWRKPYEVLLLGRRRDTYEPAASTQTADKVVRRVILGVPDLHSRKPCLKELIVPLMPNATDYRALEVFARHLVASWWSAGDQCIKYNWEGYWRPTQTIE